MKLNPQKEKANNEIQTHENGTNYILDPFQDLYSTVCTTFLEPRFYESETQTLKRIKENVQKLDPNLTMRLANYARHEMNLRSVATVLCAEAIKSARERKISIENEDAWIASVINRPDDICNLISYFATTTGNKASRITASMKRGLSSAFNDFDEYQLAKWNQNNKTITLLDAIRIVHPKPKDEKQSSIFKSILDNTIKTPYTWETRLSEAGQKGESKQRVWEELIDSDKLGYMALLRNLRNIIQVDVSYDHINKISSIISDPQRVRKSRQLPFRFYSAYSEVRGITSSTKTKVMLKAIDQAALHSVQNINAFKNTDRVFIAYDVSGSMSSTPLSSQGKIYPINVAKVMAGLSSHLAEQVVVSAFATSFTTINPPTNGVMEWCEQNTHMENRLGHGTNGHLVTEWLNNSGQEFDHVLVFSDMQFWPIDPLYAMSMSQTFAAGWRNYRRNYPNANLYMFDLAGYGHGTPITVKGNDNAYLIAGWSDEIFRAISYLREGISIRDKIAKLSPSGKMADEELS